MWRPRPSSHPEERFSTPGEKYRSVLEPGWETIDIDTAEAFAQTFDAAPRGVGLLYVAHFCRSEVCNGGFTQFFSNSTGVLAPEAVEGFVAIGQPGLASAVQRAMDMPGSPYQRDRRARWTQLGQSETENGPSAPVWEYRDLPVFRSLEDEFSSLRETEGGGFGNAADRFADGLN